MSGPATARPGFIITYQGSEVGVLARIGEPDASGDRTLHVRGGISGALEYMVPEHAVVSVDPAARRAEIDARTMFVSRSVGRDGHVLVTAEPPDEDLHLGRTQLGMCVGFTVYTAARRVGVVAAVAETTDERPPELVVRTRRIPARRYTRVAASRIVSLHEERRIVLVR